MPFLTYFRYVLYFALYYIKIYFEIPYFVLHICTQYRFMETSTYFYTLESERAIHAKPSILPNSYVDQPHLLDFLDLDLVSLERTCCNETCTDPPHMFNSTKKSHQQLDKQLKQRTCLGQRNLTNVLPFVAIDSRTGNRSYRPSR